MNEDPKIKRYSDHIATIRVSKVIGGKQVFRSRKDVQGIRNQERVRRELLDELSQLKAKTDGKDIQWKDAMVAYVTHLQERVKKNDYGEKKLKDVSSCLDLHTVKWNGDWLSEFTAHKIENLLEQIELSPDRKQFLLACIRNVFKRQIYIGRFNHNPAKELYVRVNKQRKPPSVMSRSEIDALLNYTKEAARDWYYLFSVAFFTGCRSGELWALKWADVNEDKKTIEVQSSYDWLTEKEKSTKSGHYRIIPICKKLAEILQELRSQRGKGPLFDGEYILPRLSAWKQGRAARVLGEYQKILKIKKSNFHGIRRSYITYLLAKGVAPIKVQNLAGHSDFKTTLIYVGLSGVDLKEAVEVLDLDLEPNIAKVHSIVPVKPTG